MQAYDPSFFLRHGAVVGMALVFVVLGSAVGHHVGFDFMQAILDVGQARLDGDAIRPFLTSSEAGHHPSRLGFRRFSPRRLRICTAAVLAYICAVLGCDQVGVGGPFPLIVRAVASLFRNIPVVAWAFILLFSFKQASALFFALFLTSFGYLTRCFLESIDEMSAGPVRPCASGATTARSWLRRLSP